MLLSQLEHHSNIVPWQLAGYEIDVVPLTADGRIDLDAAEGMLTERASRRRLRPCLERARLDPRREARGRDRAQGRRLLLLDGCQAAPRMPVDVAAIGGDFYAFSAHKIYGPTGIGACGARKDSSIDAAVAGRRGDDRPRDVREDDLPPRAVAVRGGTPHIVGAVGLHAAIDWVESIGLDAIHAHESALVAECRAALSAIPGVTLFGPEDSAGIVSFNVDGVHPHDIGTILDDAGVAVRAGHHCAQPLMDWLGVPATARASFAAHSDSSDIEALVRGIEQVKRIFG